MSNAERSDDTDHPYPPSGSIEISYEGIAIGEIPFHLLHTGCPIDC